MVIANSSGLPFRTDLHVANRHDRRRVVVQQRLAADLSDC
jgi:hypothetical protein